MGPNLNNLYGKNAILEGGTADGNRRIGSAPDYAYSSGWLTSKATRSWTDQLMNEWLKIHITPR